MMRFSQESESDKESDKAEGRRTGWLDVMSAEQHVQHRGKGGTRLDPMYKNM